MWLLPTRRATLRQGEPSQARQANQGRDSQMDLDIFVMRPGSGNPLTTGCGSGYIQFVTGPCSKPARGGDLGPCPRSAWALRTGPGASWGASLRILFFWPGMPILGLTLRPEINFSGRFFVHGDCKTHAFGAAGHPDVSCRFVSLSQSGLRVKSWLGHMLAPAWAMLPLG